MDRTRATLQPSIKKFIEGAIRLRAIREFLRAHFVSGNERLDFGAARRCIHAPAIPAREGGAFDEGVQREPPERIPVSPAQKPVAVNVLALDVSRITVKILNQLRCHAWSVEQVPPIFQST